MGEVRCLGVCGLCFNERYDDAFKPIDMTFHSFTVDLGASYTDIIVCEKCNKKNKLFFNCKWVDNSKKGITNEKKSQ